jgi:hypothetical protein
LEHPHIIQGLRKTVAKIPVAKNKIIFVCPPDSVKSKDLKTVPKIPTVILSEAKNLIFSFQVKKSKKRSFGLRAQDNM